MADNDKKENIRQLLNTLGRAYLEKGDYQAAIEKLEKALELDLTDRNIYHNLCKAYLGANRQDQTAMAVYERVLGYEPDNKELNRVLAEYYLQKGRDDQSAFELYERVVLQDPTNKPILLKFLHIKLQHSEHSDVKEIAQNSVRDNRAMPEVLSVYLRACWQLYAFSEAVQFLQMMLSQKLQGALLIALCRTLIRQERWSRAQGREFTLSIESCKYCAIFLSATRKVYSIDDLLLYLDVRRLLQQAIKHYGAEEENLSLTLQSLKQTPHQWLGMDMKSVLDKLEFGPGERANVLGDAKDERIGKLKDQLAEDWPHLNLLAVFCLNNYPKLLTRFGRKIIRRISETFNSICSIQLEKQGYSFVWHGDDCVIVLSQKMHDLLEASQNILQKIERFNSVEDSEEEIHIQICVHRIAEAGEIGSQQVVNNFAVMLHYLRLGQLGKDIQGHLSELQNEKIVVTEAIVKELQEAGRFRSQYIDEFRVTAWDAIINLHEVQWRDPLQSFKYAAVPKLGQFDIIDKLSESKNRVVFKATDSQLNRTVLLKAISAHSAPGINLEKFKEDFIDQARKLGRLQHPNLAVIYDVGEHAGLVYLAREFVEGQSIQHLMRSSKSTSKRHLFENILQACRGIEYAHRMNLVHGNLKPSNIMITDTGDAKVVDFDIPVLRQSILTSDGDMEHSFYLSPEHILGDRSPDIRSDIFSLGIILYELVTGAKPFQGETVQEVTDSISAASLFSPSKSLQYVTDGLSKLILTALQQDPDDRLQSVSDFEQELSKALSGEVLEDVPV